MIPAYSESAKSAIPTTTNSAYKAFLFFEDENSEHFYEEIIKKLTPHYKQFKVVCLKGKKSLLDHSKDKSNFRTKNKTIYVLDKDFDDLLGKINKDESLHYLSKYSIENYLYELESLKQIIREEKPRLSEILYENLQITSYLNEIEPNFKKLITLYFIAQKFSLGIPSCSLPIQQFTKDKTPWILCIEKIEKYKDEIFNLLLMNQFALNDNELNKIYIRHEKKITSLDHAPGKQLIDLIRLYICHIFELRGLTRDSVIYRLAISCSFESLLDLRLKIDKF